MVDGHKGSHVAAQDSMEESSAPSVLPCECPDPFWGMCSRPPPEHRWIHCGRTFLMKWLGAITLMSTTTVSDGKQDGLELASQWCDESEEIDQGGGGAEQSQVQVSADLIPTAQPLKKAPDAVGGGRDG